MIDEISGPISASMMGGIQPPQPMSDSHRSTVQKTLASSDANNLSSENINSIRKTFRSKGIRPSAELKAEIEEISSRTVDNYAEAQLDEAKAATEQAKATHLKSMSDKTDLDFVEQESGVTQERNKEKLGTQAEANKGLKQFEHDLKMQHDTGTKLKEWLNGNNAK